LARLKGGPFFSISNNGGLAEKSSAKKLVVATSGHYFSQFFASRLDNRL
jgi:hypothetical protein